MKGKDWEQAMNFVLKADFTRNRTNQLSMNSFKENVVVQFWKLVVLFKGKQEESATNRDVTDSGAHLIHEASVARANSATLTEGEVMQALGLRIDYGRIPEILPVDDCRIVHRFDTLGDITRMLSATSRVAITGPPGIGKSWLLH
jgi:hypothetical protein